MSDFKAIMYQIQFRLGLRSRPHCGSLQRSSIPHSWIKGPTSKGRGGRREGKGRKGEGVEWGDESPPLHAPTNPYFWIRPWWHSRKQFMQVVLLCSRKVFVLEDPLGPIYKSLSLSSDLKSLSLVHKFLSISSSTKSLSLSSNLKLLTTSLHINTALRAKA